MPRPGRGPRLYERKRPKGRIDFYIRDTGISDIPTGISGIENRGEAEKKLAEYIASKHDRIQRTDRDRATKSVSVASVLEFYVDEGADDCESACEIDPLGWVMSE